MSNSPSRLSVELNSRLSTSDHLKCFVPARQRTLKPSSLNTRYGFDENALYERIDDALSMIQAIQNAGSSIRYPIIILTCGEINPNASAKKLLGPWTTAETINPKKAQPARAERKNTSKSFTLLVRSLRCLCNRIPHIVARYHILPE